MRRIYVILILLLSCLIFTACGNKADYIYKTINDNTEVIILGIVDTEGIADLVIPAELGGLPVTEIEMGAFTDCAEIRSIELPSTLRNIGVAAFSGCTSLKDIKFNEDLKEISDYAFYGCVNMSNLKFPDKLEKIGNYAFDGCASIRKLKLPESCTRVGSYAFRGCTLLGTIESLGSIVTISEGAFMNCTGLKNINYPQTLKDIYTKAFSGCSSIGELVGLPETFTSIQSCAFENCVGLISVEIPKDTNNISQDAFAGSINIRTIEVNEDNIFFTSKDINGNEMNVLIKLKNAWSLLEVGTEMPIPEGVDFMIPEGVYTLFEHALDNCQDATSVELPNSFGKAATFTLFKYLPELTTVYGKAGSPAEAAVSVMKGKTFIVTE